MQIYGIKLNYFMRFCTNSNSVVLDILEEDKDNYYNGLLTLDDLYAKLKSDPFTYIQKAKKQGITNLLSIAGVCGNDYDKSNGVGKSTIMEGICYALYDKIVRKLANTDNINTAGLSIVTQFNDTTGNSFYPEDLRDSYVELFFEEKDKIYYIKRGHSFSATHKTHKPILEFECITDKNSSDSESGHRKSPTEEAILKVVGMPYDIFVNSAMVGQQDSGKFLTSGDKVRKEMLISLLNLDEIILRNLERIRQLKNDKQKQIDALEVQISTIEEGLLTADNVDTLKQKIEAFNKRLVEIDVIISKKDSEIEVLQKSEVLKQIQQFSVDIANLEQELKTKKIQSDNQLKEWNELLNKTTISIDDITNKTHRNTLKISTVQTQIKDKQEHIKNFNVEECQKKLDVVPKAYDAKPRREAELKKVEQEQQSITENIGVIKGDIKRHESEVVLLRKQLENVGSDGKFKCDKCKSIVSKQHVENEIQSNLDTIKQQQANLNTFIENQKKQAVSVEEAKLKVSKINDYIIREPEFKLQLQTHTNNIKTVEEFVKTEKELQDDQQSLHKEITKLETQKKEYIAKIEIIKEQLENETKELKTTLLDKRNKYGILTRNANEISNQINVLKTDKNNVVQEKSQVHSSIGSTNKEIENINTNNKKLTQLNKDLKNSTIMLNRLVVLDDIYGLEGVQTRVIKRYLPLLNVYLNEFMDVLTDGQMRMQIAIDEKAKIDLVISGGSGSSFYLLSGGEKMSIRIALGCALALWISNRSASKDGIVLLDEVFGPFDNTHIKAVFRLLNKLQSKFNRVLVISHNAQINENIPRKLLIEKDAGDFGYSRIKKII